MTFKAVLFFANSAYGWTETYYTGASDADTAFSAGSALVGLRRRLLGQPAQITALRVSDEANPRVSTLTPATPAITWSFLSNSDNPQTAAMMRLYSTANTRTRALYLRGSPDNAFDTSLPNNVDAQTWSQRFSDLGNFLRGVGPNAVVQAWLIKFRPRPTAGNKVQITDWTVNADSSANTDVHAIGNYPVGSFVDVYHLKGLPFSPGQCLVVGIPTAGTIFSVRYRTPSDFNYLGGGYFVPFAAAYDPITSFASTPRWTRRATGRPSGLSRGRRRSIPR